MEYFRILSTGAVYAAYLYIPWIFLLVIFRLLLHPLRDYPGPLLGRLTDAYGGFFAIKKRLHLVTYQNFQQYGPVIRQSPNRLLFNTVTALHDIYLNPGVVKGHAYLKSRLRAKYPSIINVINKTQHRRKRKYIGQALTERSMRAFEPTMSAEIDIFLRQLLASTASEKGSALDMTEKCQRLGVDIIGLLAFGHHFNTQTNDSSRFMPPIIDAMSWRINIYMHFSPLAYLEGLLRAIGIRQALQFGDTVRAIARTRMSQNRNAYHDLYSMLADDIDKGQISFDELWPEAILFIMAGGSTTSTAMSALYFYLSRNMECYTKLAKEVRTTFTSASEICSGPQLNNCKYLRSCIDEALRMSPPSPTSPWREYDPSSDKPFVVDGHVIPRGTQVGVSLYSIMHNKQYFSDPFTFNPERWLDPANGEDTEEEKQARATMRKAFAPFLIGDRACAGKSMAYMEASLTLARTLWFFDFEATPGSAGEVGGGKAGRTDGRHRLGEYQLEDIFVASHQGPNIVFRKRGEFWKDLLVIDS